MAQQMLAAVRDFAISFVIKSTTHMSEINQPTAKQTRGLTGSTVNALALVAPGAFSRLTYGKQCLYGQPMAGIAMTAGTSFGRCPSSQRKKPKGTEQEPKKI
jgi:hypothetical protein